MSNIQFTQANSKHTDIIFAWLQEPFVQEFWDNTQAHKDDILNFINGRKEPSDYANGEYVYWIASADDIPFAMIMSIQETNPAEIEKIRADHLSKTGNTYTLEYMIGNKDFFGKGYGAKTLNQFVHYFNKEIDPNADTFFIDPSVNNPRAIRVYEKAGFKNLDEYTQTGPGSGYGKPHYFMVMKV